MNRVRYLEFSVYTKVLIAPHAPRPLILIVMPRAVLSGVWLLHISQHSLGTSRAHPQSFSRRSFFPIATCTRSSFLEFRLGVSPQIRKFSMTEPFHWNSMVQWPDSEAASEFSSTPFPQVLTQVCRSYNPYICIFLILAIAPRGPWLTSEVSFDAFLTNFEPSGASSSRYLELYLHSLNSWMRTTICFQSLLWCLSHKFWPLLCVVCIILKFASLILPVVQRGLQFTFTTCFDAFLTSFDFASVFSI